MSRRTGSSFRAYRCRWPSVLSALCIVLCAPFGALAALEIDTGTGSHLITDPDVGMNGVYLGYRITNPDLTTCTDLWIEANGGTWFIPAPREDGVHRIGELAPGETKSAFFFMQAPEFAGGPYDHPVAIRTGGPDGPIIATASFDYYTWDSVRAAVLNPLLSVITSSDGPVLGSAIDVVITGEISPLGSGGLVVASPATNLDFPADVFVLESTQIILKDNGDQCQTVVHLEQDRLGTTVDTGGVFCFEYRYRFRIQAVEPGPSPILPGGYVMSGEQMKHGTFDCELSPCELPPTEAPTSAVPGAAGRGIRLVQNLPNPFNPQTTIVFDLPREQVVTLRVYDVAGRLVDVLLDKETGVAGRNEVVWRGRDEHGRAVSAGIYFYRLETGLFGETKRMVLVK